MTQLDFYPFGFYNGAPSWYANDGVTDYYLVWNVLGYWEILNWTSIYPGEPKNYTPPPILPLNGWVLEGTIQEAIFNVNLGLCVIPFRCTAPEGTYYAVEKGWIDSAYQFELVSMVLNGVQYASGEILNVDALCDLVVAPGISGGTYVQNINDWLNSIPGVSTSGFEFYDNMNSIDMPSQSSEYLIQIRRNTGLDAPFDYFLFRTGGEMGIDFGSYIGVGTEWICGPQTPVPPPPPPPTPTYRCIAVAGASYAMEKWEGEPGTLEFSLDSLILNGCQLASGQTIIIDNPTDLVVGPGIYGGTFVQNINDWLNSITGVMERGFEFHDNMTIIDKPSNSATVEICITKISGIGNNNLSYYFTSDIGGTTSYILSSPCDISSIAHVVGWNCFSL